MANPAPLSVTGWLPSYAWWPPSEEYSLTVISTPYHATVEPEAEFRFVLRGYAGSVRPVWERDLGVVPFGRELATRLDDLDLPPAPEHGGILELHSIRLDKEPARGSKFIGMWIDAQGRDGGGYLIPTIPIQGARKRLARDDLQVVPGIVASADQDSEILLLNPTDSATTGRLAVSSPDGVRAEGRPFEVGPWSAWRGSLSANVPRVRRLLEASDGVGSLAIYTGRKLLPFFALRRRGEPVSSYDHAAPIFA